MPPTVAPTQSAASARSPASTPAIRHASAAAATAKRSARERRRQVAGGNIPASGGGSGASAAIAARPRCAKRVSGPMPHRPSRRPDASALMPAPRAVTWPRPVMAMAADNGAPSGGLRVGDEVGERRDRGERALACVLVGDGHVESLLDQHDQLERVDRVEAEPLATGGLAEDRRLVEDLLFRDGEPESAHEEGLHFAPKRAAIHRTSLFRAS